LQGGTWASYDPHHMPNLRSRCTLALTLLLTSALLIVPGGKHLLICIEADGRIHVESGTEVCCDSGPPSAETSVGIGTFAGAGDDCGSCRDLLAGSAPARPTAAGSVAPPAFLWVGPDAGLAANATGVFGPVSDAPPSTALASLQTIVIRC
jgi:hypothetical protein